MKSIYEAKCIQVEITSFCSLQCPNCTRFIGYTRPYNMELGVIVKALKSLEGYEGIVGMMGGEPTMHPFFEEICGLWQEYVPFEKRALWTNGLYWNAYEDVIRETFPIKNIVYNAHDYKYEGQHQPLLIASKDIIPNEAFRNWLIDKCWIQDRWSPSINPNGAFFCEVAAAMDLLFDMKKGWEIEKDWWNKEPHEFTDQVDIFCQMCSAPIPFDKEIYESGREYLSISNWSKLEWTESFELYGAKYTKEDYERNVKDWKPGYFRAWYQHEPNIKLTKKEEETLQNDELSSK